MNAEVFIDTNVLLYTIDEDPASASKRQRAEQLLLSERWGGRSSDSVDRHTPGRGSQPGDRPHVEEKRSVRKMLNFSIKISMTLLREQR